MIVGQGPIALAVGAGGGVLDIFTLLYPLTSLSPSLWETARYRLKYCLKGPLNPKQSNPKPPRMVEYKIKCRPASWVLCNKFWSLEILLQIFLETWIANSRTKSCISEFYYDNPHSVNLSQTSLRPPPHPRRHQPGQLIYDLTVAQDVDLPKDSQTNIHSNNVPRHDSSPNNKHPQSVSQHKPSQAPTLDTNHFSSLFILK